MANRTSYGYVADTIQSNIHTHTNETILDYSLFAGGVDASAPSLTVGSIKNRIFSFVHGSSTMVYETGISIENEEIQTYH